MHQPRPINLVLNVGSGTRRVTVSGLIVILAMIVTIVHVWVKLESLSDFVEATKQNHEHSVKEPGNLRFDVLQDAVDPAKFVLYEAYVSEEAAAAHKETAHYKIWRDRVASWMAKPREGVKHILLFPQN